MCPTEATNCGILVNGAYQEIENIKINNRIYIENSVDDVFSPEEAKEEM